MSFTVHTSTNKGAVDPALWRIVRKFGPAGGPEVHELTDEGRIKAFRRANELGFAAARVLLAFADAEAARTLAVGTMRETIKSIAQTDRPRRDFVDEITTMILIGLGIARDAARSLVSDATIFIRGAAPDRLAWWRDPWSSNVKP